MKNRYLQAMGIQSWRLRQDKSRAIIPPNANPSAKYYQLAINGQTPCTLIASPATAREQQLLQAILQALTTDFTEVQAPADHQPLFSLGPHPTAVCTHSLAEMLNQPLLKAAVWRTLNRSLDHPSPAADAATSPTRGEVK